jgi:hypothetical protein
MSVCKDVGERLTFPGVLIACLSGQLYLFFVAYDGNEEAKKTGIIAKHQKPIGKTSIEIPRRCR